MRVFPASPRCVAHCLDVIWWKPSIMCSVSSNASSGLLKLLDIEGKERKLLLSFEPVALRTKSKIQLDVLLIVLRLAGYSTKLTFIQIKSLVSNFNFGVQASQYLHNSSLFSFGEPILFVVY